MLKQRLVELLLAALLLSGLLGARALAQTAAQQDQAAAAQSAAPANAPTGGDGFDFFSDKPVESKDVVQVPPEKSAWLTIAAPLALVAFFFVLNFWIWWLVPFSKHRVDINLRGLPPAARRGIAMATVMFGIAFAFGASEIWYQLQLNGGTQAFFEQMSLGKLIVMTHAHLFGFTTSFFIIGIPFSLQFPHIKSYQWVFPVGLAASLTDVMSWWGIKYAAPSFEYVSMFCGVVFSISYVWMLIGLLRVLLFPDVIWPSDIDREQRLAELRERAESTRHHEGDY
ncbi:MAG: hypothetical protein E6R07_01800 [Nevskiaceae bacterium]|nr:MAG: hypothetical protein E6R07_01800 [Nevskiaceae bacterium]